MASHPHLLDHHRYRVKFCGFRRVGLMAQAYLQPHYPVDDCLCDRLSLVRLRGCAPSAPPPLHIRPHESYQLPATVSHRLLHLLRLWSWLLQ